MKMITTVMVFERVCTQTPKNEFFTVRLYRIQRRKMTRAICVRPPFSNVEAIKMISFLRWKN